MTIEFEIEDIIKQANDNAWANVLTTKVEDVILANGEVAQIQIVITKVNIITDNATQARI